VPSVRVRICLLFFRRGDDQEWIIQLMGLYPDGDVPLGHRFAQGDDVSARPRVSFVASSRFPDTGPWCEKEKGHGRRAARIAPEQFVAPVMSDGLRSGVNCNAGELTAERRS